MTNLLADIGGTNTRCAITGPDGRHGPVQAFRNRDFDSLQSLLVAYLESLPACGDGRLKGGFAGVRALTVPCPARSTLGTCRLSRFRGCVPPVQGTMAVVHSRQAKGNPYP